MKRLLFLLLLASVCQAASVTVAESTYSYANGARVNGTLTVSWPAFSSGATSFAAGSIRASIVSGVFSIALEANDVADPAIFYTATFATARGTYSQQWVVPSVAGPLAISDVVRVSLSPITIVPSQISKVGTVAGDIIHFDGTNWARLPRGTNGQVLTVDTSLGAKIAWKTGSDGGSGTWGGIGGTLSDQTDLYNALLAKAPSLHTHAASDISSGQFTIDRLASGTPTGAKFVRDDGTLAVPAGSGGGTSAFSTVAFSATPTFSVTASTNIHNFQITLTGNVTSSTLSLASATAGQDIAFNICQDATGGRSFIWPANVLNAGAIDTTASACSRQIFRYDGTNAIALSPLLVTGATPGIVIPGSTSGSSTLQAPATGGGLTTLPNGGGVLSTLNNTNAFTGRQDATGAASTAPAKTGTVVPVTCTPGDLFFKTDATAGQNLYHCGSANVFTQQLNSGGGGGTVTSITYWPPFGIASAGLSDYTVSGANTVFVWPFSLSNSLPLGHIVMVIGAAGLSSGQGLSAGIYTSTGALVVSATPYTSTSVTATALSLPASSALTAGTYYLAITADNTSVSFRVMSDTGTSFYSPMLQLTTLPTGSCANASTGSGSSLALPSTCGAVTPITLNAFPYALLAP